MEKSWKFNFKFEWPPCNMQLVCEVQVLKDEVLKRDKRITDITMNQTTTEFIWIIKDVKKLWILLKKKQ